MVASLFTRALVPAAILFAAEQALAQSCNIKNNQGFSFYGLGSAGVYSKYKCNGNSYVQGSDTLPPAQSGRSGGGEHPPYTPLRIALADMILGDGTYDNPTHFAAAVGDPNFKQCETIYVPLLKKYFRLNEICEGCGDGHIDLWYGPAPQADWTDQSIPQALKTSVGNCGSQLGVPTGSIIKNPPKNLEVSTAQLADESGCYKAQRTFPNNQASCAGGSTSNDQPAGNTQPSPTAPVVQAPSSPAPQAPASPAPVAPKQGAQFYEKEHAVQNAPPSSSAPAPSGTGLPAIQNIYQNAVVDTTNDLEPAASSPSPSPPVTQEKDVKTTTKGQGVNACPPNGWVPGCVWGSGAGQIGDACQYYTDCAGENVCAGGKCADHSRRVRRGLQHRRRHALGAAVVGGMSH